MVRRLSQKEAKQERIAAESEGGRRGATADESTDFAERRPKRAEVAGLESETGETVQESTPDLDASDPVVSVHGELNEAEAAQEAARAEGDTESLFALTPDELRSALEAVLFSSSEPIAIRALAELFETTVHDVRAAVESLREEYLETGRAFRVEDIAGGVQILTHGKYDPWIRKLRKKSREGKLSPAALETLSVIAYKQPIHKADLEAIRGVACGPILKTLLDRGLVQIVGRAEGLGKPLLYGTTKRFLESFGLHSIRELPQPDLEAAREIAEGKRASSAKSADEEPAAGTSPEEHGKDPEASTEMPQAAAPHGDDEETERSVADDDLIVGLGEGASGN